MSETHDETTPAELDAGVEDFDAFWQGVDRTGKAVRIMGEVIHLPASLPLQFEMEARRLQRSKRDQDVRKLLSLLGFPEDAQERWAERGMDLEQFQVLLAWAPQVIAGNAVTLAEVREFVQRENAKRAEGKAPSRS